MSGNGPQKSMKWSENTSGSVWGRDDRKFGAVRASGVCFEKDPNPPPRLFHQLSFEPGSGAHQSLAQKIKVPFSRIFSFFPQF